MTKNGICSLLLTTLLAGAGFAAAQTAPAPAAAAPTGCPAPGEGRGPRPGGPGGPGGPGQAAGGARPAVAPGGQGAAQAQGPGRGGPGGDQAGGPPKKRLLIWADTRNGIAQHDIAHAEAVIEELGYKSGLWDTWIRTDSNIISRRPKMTTGQPASGGPSLCNVDAIFFLGHREIELDAQGKADLLWFVHDAGKGFVAAHTGTTAFMLSWPEFGEMLGGEFDEHPWGTIEAPVIVTDHKFPGLTNFPPVFNIKEEFYQSKNFSPEKSRVLMRLDTTKTDNSKRGVQAADYPYALVWAKTYGKGRVFYSAFGHSPATWDNPMLQEMYTGAIKWALGMVDGDASPMPMPPPRARGVAASGLGHTWGLSAGFLEDLQPEAASNLYPKAVLAGQKLLRHARHAAQDREHRWAKQHDKHAWEDEQNKGKDNLNGCFRRKFFGKLPAFLPDPVGEGAQGTGDRCAESFRLQEHVGEAVNVGKFASSG